MIGDQIVVLMEERAQASGSKVPTPSVQTHQQKRSSQPQHHQPHGGGGMGGASGGRGSMQGGNFGGRGGGGMRPAGAMQGSMMPMHGMSMMPSGGEFKFCPQ